MSGIPDMEIIGDVTSFNLERSADGSAVLVAYAEGEGGTTGRAWLRFAPEAATELRRYADWAGER